MLRKASDLRGHHLGARDGEIGRVKDFYFDDQTRHCESAAQAGPTGHVPSGIANPPG